MSNNIHVVDVKEASQVLHDYADPLADLIEDALSFAQGQLSESEFVEAAQAYAKNVESIWWASAPENQPHQ